MTWIELLNLLTGLVLFQQSPESFYCCIFFVCLNHWTWVTLVRLYQKKQNKTKNCTSVLSGEEIWVKKVRWDASCAAYSALSSISCSNGHVECFSRDEYYVLSCLMFDRIIMTFKRVITLSMARTEPWECLLSLM